MTCIGKSVQVSLLIKVCRCLIALRRYFFRTRMHLAKPDVEIFQAVLKEAGLKADEVLFIDDSEENCQAAAKLGIGVCHYVPGDNLEVQLQKFIV